MIRLPRQRQRARQTARAKRPSAAPGAGRGARSERRRSPTTTAIIRGVTTAAICARSWRPVARAVRGCRSTRACGALRSLAPRAAARCRASTTSPTRVRTRQALRAWAEREFPDAHEVSWFELDRGGEQLAHRPRAAGAARRDPCRRGRWPRRRCRLFALDLRGEHDARQLRRPGRDAADRRSQLHRALLQHSMSPRGDCARWSGARRPRRDGCADGRRHAVIVACMVAMYLSKDSARAPACARDRLELDSGGRLADEAAPTGLAAAGGRPTPCVRHDEAARERRGRRTRPPD